MTAEAGTRSLPGTHRLPTLPRTFLARSRLWECLDDGARGALTTVTAPAGSGKTMGVAGWLQDRSRHDARAVPPTWLDAAGPLTSAELAAALDRAADAADEAGDSRDGVGIVVVDNAERLEPACVALVDDALDRAPQRMHLVLLSRWDVPLRRLVPAMLGLLTDLRGDVVRLDDDEAAALVRLHAPDAPESVVRRILDQAQGWCAVVVLAARAARAAGLRAASPLRPSTQGPLVSDLMAREVFASLSPRERHVLLSICHEPSVTAADACLAANEPRALDVLEAMEETGLLVQRDVATEAEGGARFRVHPMLLDVVRRRFVTGGVDVQRAQATIARSSDVELARGNLGRALELAAVGGGSRASAFVGEHGLLMVLRGDHARIAALATSASTALRAEPSASLALAVERWFADDAVGVGQWLEPLPEPVAGDLRAEAGSAIAGLLRASLGLEALGPATRTAVALAQTRGGSLQPGYRALLLTLIGSAQTWLGDLRDAESSLSSAILAARSEGAGALEHVAMGNLALTEYLRGREPGSAGLVRLLSEGSTLPSVGGPAAVTALLARMHTEPWTFVDPAAPTELTAPLSSGLAGEFWAWVARARSLALRGRAVEAQVVLGTPAGLALPRHLDIVLEVERALLAVVSGDVDRLRESADALHRLDAPDDEALVRGFLAACRGELGAAARLLEAAASGADRGQPDTVTLALVAGAQVADALGSPAGADVLLAGALRRAEHRGSAYAFVGWLGHATPVPLLLARATAGGASTWVQHLADGLATAGPLSSRVSFLSPTAQETRSATTLVATPPLTSRERDVLLHLARGATYEDISATLFVTTNTVKTHVTNLYKKLGARTRSEALAAARSQFLL
ncbi:LuxR C-terminal-related transcriptional regulator [Cellulomonas sp. 179-A 4D5 NHS]|uniref:LuxR C-terminal-related transcriptional regulator n=1 Tax=Cellulomonas sp. 179-A 4D5 NHS TaxID=3142378 RepID=UPI0039A090B3